MPAGQGPGHDLEPEPVLQVQLGEVGVTAASDLENYFYSPPHTDSLTHTCENRKVTSNELPTGKAQLSSTDTPSAPHYGRGKELIFNGLIMVILVQLCKQKRE